MAQKLVQVQFTLTVSGDEYVQIVAPLAQAVRIWPGSSGRSGC